MELSGQRHEYIGYFPQWAIYDQQFRISGLGRNGTASKLTILNCAFANISSDTKLHLGYRCFAANADGADAGDASADWLWPFAAEESVDGVADQGWDAGAAARSPTTAACGRRSTGRGGPSRAHATTRTSTPGGS